MADALNTNATLAQELPNVIEQARDACSINGDLSKECAAAWDVVEEIQAAISHRKAVHKSSLELYCEGSPDAAECRIYDV